MNNQLDFFYGKESEQFNFVRVPKLLFRDERFKGLSSASKLVYAVLLERLWTYFQSKTGSWPTGYYLCDEFFELSIRGW